MIDHWTEYELCATRLSFDYVAAKDEHALMFTLRREWKQAIEEKSMDDFEHKFLYRNSIYDGISNVGSKDLGPINEKDGQSCLKHDAMLVRSSQSTSKKTHQSLKTRNNDNSLQKASLHDQPCSSGTNAAFAKSLATVPLKHHSDSGSSKDLHIEDGVKRSRKRKVDHKEAERKRITQNAEKISHRYHYSPDYYNIVIGERCPYCTTVVATMRDYVCHMKKHKEMLKSKALIHVCQSCQFRSATINQLFKHWAARGSKVCALDMQFDYIAAEAAATLTNPRKQTQAPTQAGRTMRFISQPSCGPHSTPSQWEPSGIAFLVLLAIPVAAALQCYLNRRLGLKTTVYDCPESATHCYSFNHTWDGEVIQSGGCCTEADLVHCQDCTKESFRRLCCCKGDLCNAAADD